MRFEWRTKGEGSDALIAVDDATNSVREIWDATAPLIEDFLNDMTEVLSETSSGNTEVDEQDPEQWGVLVISRTDEGDVISVDPELYWNRIADWFRSRGSDPHPWRGRR